MINLIMKSKESMTESEYLQVLHYVTEIILEDKTPKTQIVLDNNYDKTRKIFESDEEKIRLRLEKFEHHGYGYSGKTTIKGVTMEIGSSGLYNTEIKRKFKRITSKNIEKADEIVKEGLEIFNQMIDSEKMKNAKENSEIKEMHDLESSLGYVSSTATKNIVNIKTSSTIVEIFNDRPDKVYRVSFRISDVKKIKNILEALEDIT